jgi:hypothetical protein
MPLKKLPISQTSLNPDGSDFRPSPEMEAEFLKHKHLGFQTPEWLDSIGQKPLMGFGGEGRKMPSLSEVDEEAREKFWAMMMGENHNQKRMTKGGHGVPLSSKSINPLCSISAKTVRLHERPVLCSYYCRYPSPRVQGRSRHWIFQPLGPFHRVYLDRLFRKSLNPSSRYLS